MGGVFKKKKKQVGNRLPQPHIPCGFLSHEFPLGCMHRFGTERIKISNQIKIPARTLLLFGGVQLPRVHEFPAASFPPQSSSPSLLLGAALSDCPSCPRAVACSPLRLYAPLAPACFWIPLLLATPTFPSSSQQPYHFSASP